MFDENENNNNVQNNDNDNDKTNASRTVALSKLHAHPQNSNVMPGALLKKLKQHIARSGHYPPIIVRPHPDEVLRTKGGYEILDGHHRVEALRSLKHTVARCDVWPVSNDEALLLLATLNRLEGRDDPAKRADLIATLIDRSPQWHRDAIALLPERAEALNDLMQLREAPPSPRRPVPMAEMPTSVHFFLLPEQRKQLEAVLASIDDNREHALMQLAQQHISSR